MARFLRNFKTGDIGILACAGETGILTSAGDTGILACAPQSGTSEPPPYMRIE